MTRATAALLAIALAVPILASARGGHYTGGHGSSHKGGHYSNARTHNHYEKRK